MVKNQRHCVLNAAAKIALVVLVSYAPGKSFAESVKIQFDLVKVTARAGAGADAGFNLYSATPVGDGPYKTMDGDAAIDFFKQKPNGDMPTFLNGFTGAGVFANQFDSRYFGSVAAPKGSVLRNFTDTKFTPQVAAPGYKTEMVAGKSIGGFEIKVAQPTQDSIDTASGGNAFPNTAIAADKKSVTFSGGDILVGNFPTAGNSGNFLWSFISPAGDQPKFPQVMFTTPVIPPDPAGEFKNIKYVGNAVAVVPEPGMWLLMLSGLTVVAAFGALRNSGGTWRFSRAGFH